MPERTLVQILGTGTTRLTSAASAPSAGLFIPDSVLVSVGLTTPTTATGEAHIVALLKILKGTLTQTSFAADTDNSIYVEDGYSSFTTRGITSYRVDQIVLNLAKIDSDATLNPSDY